MRATINTPREYLQLDCLHSLIIGCILHATSSYSNHVSPRKHRRTSTILGNDQSSRSWKYDCSRASGGGACQPPENRRRCCYIDVVPSLTSSSNIGSSVKEGNPRIPRAWVLCITLTGWNFKHPEQIQMDHNALSTFPGFRLGISAMASGVRHPVGSLPISAPPNINPMLI